MFLFLHETWTHASNCHRTVSPVEIASGYFHTYRKFNIGRYYHTNTEFNWLDLTIGSVLISFFAKCLFFYTFFNVHSKTTIAVQDFVPQFNSAFGQCDACLPSTPEKWREKPESNSKLVKRRQWWHTWLDVLMVKLRIKCLARASEWALAKLKWHFLQNLRQ